MQRCFCYTSTQELPCVTCLPAPLILCINPDLIVNQLCPEQEGVEPFQRGYIEATLTKAMPFFDGCAVKRWNYTICYDDIQLVEGTAVLTSSDIFGLFCKQCKENWVEDLVGNEVFVRVDEVEGGQTVVLVSQHGCEYPFTPGVTVSTACFVEGSGIEGDPVGLTPSVDENSVIIGDGEGCWTQVSVPECGFLHRAGDGPLEASAPFFSNHGSLGSDSDPIAEISGVLEDPPNQDQSFPNIAPFEFTNEEDCDVMLHVVVQITSSVSIPVGVGGPANIFRSWTFSGGAVPGFARNDEGANPGDTLQWYFQHDYGYLTVAPGASVNLNLSYTITNFAGAEGADFTASVTNYFWAWWRK